jgi:hypothetical protein
LEDVPLLSISDDQILVRVHDAGVNPIDWKIREGYLPQVMPVSLPPTIGQDLADEVAERGRNAKRFEIDERVCGFTQGAYAEYAAAPESTVAAMPDVASGFRPTSKNIWHGSLGSTPCGRPQALFLDHEGKERERLEGYLPNQDFVAVLESGLGWIAFLHKKYIDAEGWYADVVARFRHSHSALGAIGGASKQSRVQRLGEQGDAVAAEGIEKGSCVMSSVAAQDKRGWPARPLQQWKDAHATLHMWTQIVGKVRLYSGAGPIRESDGEVVRRSHRNTRAT